MKEAILEPVLRKMRLNKILPSFKEFSAPNVLDVGCGWEARLLKEIAPHISRGVGLDFKAPRNDEINIKNIFSFSFFFEEKENHQISALDSKIAEELADFLGVNPHTHTRFGLLAIFGF